MAILANGIELKAVLIIVGALLLTLIIFYIAFANMKFKSVSKKAFKNKKLSKKYGSNSVEIKEICDKIKKTKKYNGKYKSLNGSTKKKIKKFFHKWFEEIPYFVMYSRKAIDKKDFIVHFVAQLEKEAEKETITFDFPLNLKKSYKVNYKKLVKILKKYPVTLALIETLGMIWDEESVYFNDGKKERENHQESVFRENGYLVSYIVSRKKKIKKANLLISNDDEIEEEPIIVNEKKSEPVKNEQVQKNKDELDPEAILDDIIENKKDVNVNVEVNDGQNAINDTAVLPQSINEIEFKTLDEIDNDNKNNE